MRSSVAKKITQWTAVLLVAGGLKLYYSSASANDLLWVLAPTTFLVEIVTGETFRFESYAGYMNADQSFLIGVPCAGLNFLVAAFLMLAIARLWRNHPKNTGWSMISAVLFIAYFATLLANTVRIAVAIRMLRMNTEVVWVNPEQLHRFEGIFIYFGFMLLLFVLSESVYEGEVSRKRNKFFLLRRSFLPLMIYWAITLGIPIANGAYSYGTGFWEHSLFVLLTPLILALPLAVFLFLKTRNYAS